MVSCKIQRQSSLRSFPRSLASKESERIILLRHALCNNQYSTTLYNCHVFLTHFRDTTVDILLLRTRYDYCFLIVCFGYDLIRVAIENYLSFAVFVL